MSEAGLPDIIGSDETSFEDFVASSSGRLFTLASLLTGGHRAEAEDLLQGAFERAYRRWGRISRRGDPERYVRQMLVNASVDRWRRLRRHRESPLAVGGADPGAGDATAAVADRDLLLRGLAALAPRQRAVLVLRYFEGLSEAQRATEPPTAGLLEGIRRKHRRHLRRVGAACLAGVAAAGIAVPLATGRILTGPAPTTAASPAGPAVRPAARPGPVLRDCQSSNNGTMGSGWQADSVQAGPVWFISMRPKNTAPSSQRLVTGKLTASAMAIAISNGRTAVVTAAPATKGRYRFLAHFNYEGNPYTLAEGAPGLTLVGCPAGPAGTGTPASSAPGLTMFWEGYVTDLQGCISLEVRTSPTSQPIRVTLPAAPGGGCGA